MKISHIYVNWRTSSLRQLCKSDFRWDWYRNVYISLCDQGLALIKFFWFQFRSCHFQISPSPPIIAVKFDPSETICFGTWIGELLCFWNRTGARFTRWCFSNVCGCKHDTPYSGPQKNPNKNNSPHAPANQIKSRYVFAGLQIESKYAISAAKWNQRCLWFLPNPACNMLICAFSEICTSQGIIYMYIHIYIYIYTTEYFVAIFRTIVSNGPKCSRLRTTQFQNPSLVHGILSDSLQYHVFYHEYCYRSKCNCEYWSREKKCNGRWIYTLLKHRVAWRSTIKVDCVVAAHDVMANAWRAHHNFVVCILVCEL